MAITDTLTALTNLSDQLTQIENAQTLSASIRARLAKLGMEIPAALDTIDADVAAQKAAIAPAKK